MTDITTKLRASLLCDAINGNQFERSVCGRQMREAADEIERLRAELDSYREASKHLVAELDDALEDARKYCEAQAEIARLREALAVFVHAHHSGNSVPPHIVEQARAVAPVEAK